MSGEEDVLKKDRFDECVTYTGDNMIRIVLNRSDVSGQDHRIHTSEYYSPNQIPIYNISDPPPPQSGIAEH
jgi:hypothetical protein